MLGGMIARRRARGRGTVALVLAVLAPLAGLVAAQPAAASRLKEEFSGFAHCPVEQASICLSSITTSGEFVLDHKTVPIDKTITLQGGIGYNKFTTQPLIAPVGAPALSDTSLTVPGGLVGIEGLGGEVTATAEIAGPVSAVTVNELNLVTETGTAVTLPLKIKLNNPTLGEDCYIGTESEPVVLHLTTGKTSPPWPFSSIDGSRGTTIERAKGKIRLQSGASLVDNDFSVPGATGCGGALSLIVDPLVDTIVGIPAPAGFNKAVLTGTLEETSAENAAKYKPKVKKEKK